MKMIFQKEKNTLIARGAGETIKIEPYGRDCLRFRSTLNREIAQQNWTLLPQKDVNVEINILEEKATIKNGKIIGEISSDGRVRYLNENGEVIFEELWIDGRVMNANLLKARNYEPISSDLYEVSLYFEARDDEKFYGMGQYANGYLNLKGCVLELAQRNTQISIPFLVSNRKYGFIWNNPSIGRAELVKNTLCGMQRQRGR